MQNEFSLLLQQREETQNKILILQLSGDSANFFIHIKTDIERKIQTMILNFLNINENLNIKNGGDKLSFYYYDQCIFNFAFDDIQTYEILESKKDELNCILKECDEIINYNKQFFDKFKLQLSNLNLNQKNLLSFVHDESYFKINYNELSIHIFHFNPIKKVTINDEKLEEVKNVLIKADETKDFRIKNEIRLKMVKKQINKIYDHIKNCKSKEEIQEILKTIEL